MVVYTDGIHLGGDELEELHRFARSIGLKRKWFQNHPRHPHYDLTSPKKLEEAISKGVEHIKTKEFLKKILKAYEAELKRA
jgi:hypothetical protein